MRRPHAWLCVPACVRARRRRRLRAPVQSGGFGGHSWAEALQSDGATGGRMRSGRRRGFRTAELSQPAPTFRPQPFGGDYGCPHSSAVSCVWGRAECVGRQSRAVLLCDAARRCALQALWHAPVVLCGCLFVRLFVCLRGTCNTPRLSCATNSRRFGSRAAASCARLSRCLLTSRPFRPFAGLPTWTSFRSSASAFSPQARRRRRRRSAAHATPSAVAYRTPASLRCARLRVIRRGSAGITTQSLPATFGSFHVTDVLALTPQPMRCAVAVPPLRPLRSFALHGAKTAPEGSTSAAAPRALHLAV